MNLKTATNLRQRIRLSFRYAKAIYLISGALSAVAITLCFFDPSAAATFIVLKALSIPVILYLFKSFSSPQSLHFYINLGIGRTEYYAIPAAVEAAVFVLLMIVSVSLSYGIR